MKNEIVEEHEEMACPFSSFACISHKNADSSWYITSYMGDYCREKEQMRKEEPEM
jgi:hypothetical protein